MMSLNKIARRATRQVAIGGVRMGGNAPIVVQSMTNTDTADAQATSDQVVLRAQMPAWKLTYPGVESMAVAVMGCVVNGPGESKMANIGISLPGTGEMPVAPVYEDGVKTVTLKGQRIAEDFQRVVDAYVRRTYGGGTLAANAESSATRLSADTLNALAAIPVKVAQ